MRRFNGVLYGSEARVADIMRVNLIIVGQHQAVAGGLSGPGTVGNRESNLERRAV
jgi:hypothetical protein